MKTISRYGCKFLGTFAFVVMHAALCDPHGLFLFLTVILCWDGVEGINYFLYLMPQVRHLPESNVLADRIV
jgi:hypothetical protein